MKILGFTALLFLVGSLCLAADLPRSSPEAQGVSSSQVLAFVEAADARLDTMHSLMLVRHGRVVAEGWWAPYRASSPHSLYSLSKSFTSTAVGLAIAEGKLSVDDEVRSFFPDATRGEPTKNQKAMRISDLLRMSTGHEVEPKRTQIEPWTKTFLDQPVPHKPGTHFLYNTSGTYMLSAIVQRATGVTVLDYLKPRLFEPLGIEHPTWEASPQGISAGGYGLSVRTEDIAKFGELYLRRGLWNGRQVVPAAWVDAATARQTSNGSDPKSDWAQGYGYQFWRCRHGAYRGDGAFGQFCVVLPDQDAVIAITSGVRDMQGVLDLVWDKLLPALKPAALPTDDAARTKLERVLAGLTIRPLKGSVTPTEAVAKAAARRHAFPSNERKLESAVLDGDTLILRIAGAEHRVACGSGSWTKGRLALGLLAEQPMAASGGWTADDTFEAKICFYETPFIVTLSLKYAGNELRLDQRANVGFGPTKPTPLVGTAD